MRIGIVHPAFLRRGGAENLTLWLASGLAQRGHAVTLFAAGLALDRWSEIDLTGVRTVELPDRHDSFWHEPSRSRHHGGIIAEHSSDADVMVCGIHPAHLWLSQALALMSRPPASVLYCHEPRRKYYYMWTDWPTVTYVDSGQRTLPLHDKLARLVRYRRRANRLSKAPFARWYDRREMARLDRIVANSRFTVGGDLGSSRDPTAAGESEPEGQVLAAQIDFRIYHRPLAIVAGVVIQVRHAGRQQCNQDDRQHIMQFTRALRDRVRSGEITTSIRIWKQPKITIGGRYPLAPGEIIVESLLEISIRGTIMKQTVYALGLALASIVASWALFLDLAMLYETHGFWSGVVGLLLAPITYLVMPWYAWIALDEWLPLAVGYGSLAVGLVFIRLGGARAKR